MKTKEELKKELRYFTGSQGLFYRVCPFYPIVGTEGIRFIEEEMNASWLISDLAIDAQYVWQAAQGSTDALVILKEAVEVPSGTISEGLQDMQFWELTVHKDGSADLELRADCDQPVEVRQHYDVTDFPLESIRIWVAPNGSGLTMYLPSEH